MRIELPDTLSGLLRLAVADAQKCANDPRYVLQMGSWHEPGLKRCSVCMAGAVMAQSLNTQLHAVAFPEDYDDSEYALMAIDEMRCGDVLGAASTLGLMPNADQEVALCKAGQEVRADFDVVAGRASWDTYLKAATILEKAGL
jgi:hypothetical protein